MSLDGLLDTHDQQELRKLMVLKALNYHKTVEGEYGCPGEECPGVQRLVTLLEQWTIVALAVIEPGGSMNSSLLYPPKEGG